MRVLIAIFLVALAAIATLAFFSSYGYAKGGGEVSILPKTYSATSDYGQAVVVQGDIENFNASNTPPQSPDRNAQFDKFTSIILGMAVFCGLGILVLKGVPGD